MRIVLVVAGVAMGCYGALLLWDNPWQILLRIVIWAVVAAVVHDAVFAPLCAALGYAGRRLVPGPWWTPVAVAGVATVVLGILAIPVFTKPGMRPDNPTVLDRDYPTGLLIAIVVVWACVPAYHLLARLLPVRQDQMVDQKRPDDVEGQPPAV